MLRLKRILRAQGLFQVARQTRLFGVTSSGRSGSQQRLAQQLFDVADADFGQGDVAVLFVDLIIFGFQLFDDLGHLAVPFQVAGGRARR